MEEGTSQEVRMFKECNACRIITTTNANASIRFEYLGNGVSKYLSDASAQWVQQSCFHNKKKKKQTAEE